MAQNNLQKAYSSFAVSIYYTVADELFYGMVWFIPLADVRGVCR